MAQVGSLYASLTLESASFVSNMKKAADAAERSGRQIESAISLAKGAATAFIGSQIVQSLYQAGKAALDYASSLAETAQQLGVTSKDLQIYRYAASQVGVEQETMDRSLAKLTLTIGKAAAGAKEPAKAFADLGISVRDASGHVRTAGDLIPDLAAALGKISDPAQRAALEVALFGKAGQALDTLLAGGRKGVDDLAAAAQRLGYVLSDRQLQDADKAADKLADLKKVLEANIARVVSDNASSIYRFADSLTELAAKIPAAVNWLSQLPTKLNIAQNSLFGHIMGNPGIRAGYAALADRQRGELAEMKFQTTPFGSPMFWPTSGKAKPAAAAGGSLGGGGGGGGRSRRSGGSAAAGPSLGEQFQQLQDRLDPGQKAIKDYEAAIDLIDRAGRAGLSTADDLDHLRASAQIDLSKSLGLEEVPIEVTNVDRTVTKLTTTIGNLKSQAPNFRNTWTEAFQTIEEAGVDGLMRGIEGLMRGFGGLKDLALSVLDSIAGSLVDTFIATPLKNAVAGIGRAGKANGGYVPPGWTGAVGERGAELFSSGKSGGNIIPHRALSNMTGRSGDVYVSQTFAPNLAGNAVDRAEMIRFGAMVKQDTMATWRDIGRRRG